MACLLVFDIDGTLLTTGGCGKAALERAFEKHFGIPHAWGNLIPDGKTDLLIFNEIANKCLGRKLTPSEWKSISERYADYFAEESENSIHFKVMPGAFKLLEYLSDIPGVHLTLGTGNIERVSWMKLRKVRLHGYFRCGGFGENHTDRASILRDALRASENHFNKRFSKLRTYVIGDTEHDVKGAKALRLRSIGVDTGSNQGRDFEKMKPTHRIKDLSDLDTFTRMIQIKTNSSSTR